MQLLRMPKRSRKNLAEYITVAIMGVGLVGFGVWAFNEWLHQTEIASTNSDFMIGGPISVLVGIALFVAGIQLSRDWAKTKREQPTKT
jgi:predicted transporter